MNKTELITAMAEKTGVSKADCTKTLFAALEAIAETLSQGDKVQLAGFGTFEVRERKARTGRNPKTGETVEIAAAKVPAFKAGKALKDSVES